MTAHWSKQPLLRVLMLALFVSLVAANIEPRHEHHDEDVGPYEQNFTNEEEMDSVLKWHIAFQIGVWGLLFPAGMVLGITRSRFHAPLQALGCVLTLAGNYLGHHHSGRSFHTTGHSHFANYLWWYLISQTSLGIFLKLHVMEGTKVRRVAVVAHGVIGKSFPVVGWAQMLLGGIAALGFCFGEHTLQCVAHFAMGSGFIIYGVLLLLMFRVGVPWLARRQCSQEFIDSWVLMVLGIFNTFTEHDFLRKSSHWSHKDMQHVSLGVLWWTGGALGIFLSRKGQRNIVPAILIIFTGFAMSAHAQSLEFSTTVHKIFGYTLSFAGLARLIEVCFVLRDGPSSTPRAFQHLTPYLLVLSGLTFLSSTEEQMQWVAGSGMDSTTYANILFSGAFVLYLAAVFLVELYERGVAPKESNGNEGRAGGDIEAGRSWYGIPIPSSFTGSGFPGIGRSLRDGGQSVRNDDYVPMSQVPDSGYGGDREVFEVGGDEDEDGGDDAFWEEREEKERRRREGIVRE